MRCRAGLLSVLILLAFTSTASAYAATSAAVPVAIDLAKAWIKNHPDRAEGYFFLGGVEGFAWAKGAAAKDSHIPCASLGNSEIPPKLVPYYTIMYERDAKMEITPDDSKSLGASIAAYRKAVELDSKNPLYQLGLAWSLEEAAKAKLDPADAAGDVAKALTDDEHQQCQTAITLLVNGDPSEREHGAKVLGTLMPRSASILLAVKSNNAEVTARIDKILKDYWLGQATEHYRKAYEQSVGQDLNADFYILDGDTTISVKAGDRLLVLLPAQPDATPDEIGKIEKALKTIKAKVAISLPH